MKKNFYVLLAISVLFGLSFGIYELSLPLYLKSRGFTPVQGSLVFAVPALCALLMRLVSGRISDLWGRRILYSISLLFCSVTTFMTPFFRTLLVQLTLKSVRDASMEVKKTIHSVMLYESVPRRFLDFIGKTLGAETFCQAIGALLVGYGMGSWTESSRTPVQNLVLLLLVSGFLLSVCTVVARALLSETLRSSSTEADGGGTKLRILLKLDPRLALITVAMFIFNIGLGCSHCYIMPLFFQDKFGAEFSQLGWIMAGHRLTMAVPLILAGWLFRGRVLKGGKLLVAGFIFYEGIALTVSGMIPGFLPAVIIWLTHDFLGAGMWSPINNTLMQRYSRSEYRGNDVAISMSASYLGFVVGAVLGGFFYTEKATIILGRILGTAYAGKVFGLPFAVGGIFMMVAAPFYVFLHFWDRGDKLADAETR